MLALAGLVGVPYDPVMIVALLALLFLTALAITAFGLMISVRIKRFQAVMPIMQLVLTPMMFLSGSMFPLAGLPVWLAVLTRVNPLTYAVEPMRHIVFDQLDLTPASRRRLDPGITWGGWVVPVWLQGPGGRAARHRRCSASPPSSSGGPTETGVLGMSQSASGRSRRSRSRGRPRRRPARRRRSAARPPASEPAGTSGLQQVARAGVGADDQIVAGLPGPGRSRRGRSRSGPSPCQSHSSSEQDPVPAGPLAGRPAGRGCWSRPARAPG